MWNQKLETYPFISYSLLPYLPITFQFCHKSSPNSPPQHFTRAFWLYRVKCPSALSYLWRKNLREIQSSVLAGARLSGVLKLNGDWPASIATRPSSRWTWILKVTQRLGEKVKENVL